MNVTIQDAYEEACRALGEGVVTQRLMAAEIARLQGENDALRTALGGPPLDEDRPSTEHL